VRRAKLGMNVAQRLAVTGAAELLADLGLVRLDERTEAPGPGDPAVDLRPERGQAALSRPR
jgi:hypothetical protein